MALKTEDTVENFLPSPGHLQEMLALCKELPDPFLANVTRYDTRDIAKELIHAVYGLPRDFVG